MSRYLNYIHNLRGLAILFVVGVHAGMYDHDWGSHPGARKFLQVFFDPSEGNGTVLFLFIGGFLFQYLTHHQFVFKKFLEQKFLNIILPYVIISIPLIIIRLNTNYESLTLPEGFNEKPLYYQFVYHLVTGSHMPPFWFISTIILFYFTAPLLHRLDNPAFYKYGFPIVFATLFFTYRPEHNANTFLAYLHFIPIYVAGMWASYYRQQILSLGWKALAPLLLVYGGLTYLDLSGNITLSRDITFEYVISSKQLLFNIYMFKAMILCFSLLFVFHKLRSRSMPFLEILGHYSFGIFFVHYILISVARKLLEHFNFTIDFSLLTYLIFFTFILMTSVWSVSLVKRFTGRYSRYLIGS